jgi:hypothetical protein
MKIAQIAPLYEAVPPSLYGGTERIVAHLTNALVELGHDVTLFASGRPIRGRRWFRYAIKPFGSISSRLNQTWPLTCPCCMNFICAGTNSIFCISMSISSIFHSSKIWRRGQLPRCTVGSI